MDMSHKFRAAAPARPLDWAVLVATVAARQAASPTAATQSRLDRPEAGRGRFTPGDGRFSAAAAGLLAEWKEG